MLLLVLVRAVVLLQQLADVCARLPRSFDVAVTFRLPSRMSCQKILGGSGAGLWLRLKAVLPVGEAEGRGQGLAELRCHRGRRRNFWPVNGEQRRKDGRQALVVAEGGP